MAEGWIELRIPWYFHRTTILSLAPEVFLSGLFAVRLPCILVHVPLSMRPVAILR